MQQRGATVHKSAAAAAVLRTPMAMVRAMRWFLWPQAVVRDDCAYRRG